METRGSAKSGVLMGAALVVLGTALLLERMDVMHTDLMRHFWPVAWMVFGLIIFVGNPTPLRRAFGVVLILLGVGLELDRYDLIRFRVRDLWPMYIIALGVFMLWRAIKPPAIDQGKTQLLESRLSEYAIFGGGEFKVVTNAFEGGNVMAVFGGQEVDLTNSKLKNGSAIVYADAIFGGVSLKVPQTWRVTTHGPAIFGGVENKALPPAESADGEQHLVVKVLAVFGGVEIKN